MGSATGQSVSPLSVEFDRAFGHINPFLRVRVLAVLRRLNCIAAGTTSRYAVDKTTGSAASSSPPPVVDSPFHTFFTRFLNAPNEAALEAYVEEAEVEAATLEGATPGRFRARRMGDREWDDKAEMERVVNEYEGDSPELAALKEGNPRYAEWIRKARRTHRRDEETGEGRRGWDGWDHAERTAQVRRLWDQGVKRKPAAKKLMISEGTLQKYWPGRVDKRAA